MRQCSASCQLVHRSNLAQMNSAAKTLMLMFLVQMTDSQPFSALMSQALEQIVRSRLQFCSPFAIASLSVRDAQFSLQILGKLKLCLDKQLIQQSFSLLQLCLRSESCKFILQFGAVAVVIRHWSPFRPLNRCVLVLNLVNWSVTLILKAGGCDHLLFIPTNTIRE